MTSESKRSKLTTFATATAITIGAVGGTAAVAAAAHTPKGSTSSHSAPKQQGDHRGMPDRMGHLGSGGTVTAIDATSITVKGLDGTTSTFTIDGSTSFSKEHAAATAADVSVGSRVRVIPTAPGSTTAKEIDIDLPHLMGTVSNVDGTTITVTDIDGFWRTISTNGSTSYTTNGAAGSSSDVTEGKVIMATGSVDANHTTLDASSISIGLPQGGPGDGPRHGPMGEMPPRR